MQNVLSLEEMLEAFKRGTTIRAAVKVIESNPEIIKSKEPMEAAAYLPKKILEPHVDIFQDLGFKLGNSYNHTLAHLTGSILCDAIYKDVEVADKLGGFSYFSATKLKGPVQKLVMEQLQKLGGIDAYREAVDRISRMK